MPKLGNDKKLHLPLLLFLLLLLPSFLSYNNDNNAWGAFGIPAPPLSDAEALLAFKAKADPGNRLPFLANRSADYCRWAGVRCSTQGRVIRLVLEGYSLNGTFAGRTLPRLDQLRILSLKANALAGPIPDLSGLLNLKALFLDHNLFSGSFPASLLSLHRLRTLDLSHNSLSGHIPPALASLDRLYFLHLEWNRFNGSVPPLNQSSLKVLNVSNNDLSGAVPVTAALSAFDASAFAGNPGLCGEVVRKECGSHFQFFHGGGGDGGGQSVAPSPAAAAGLGGQHAGFLLPGSASPSQKMHKRAIVVIEFLAGAFLVIGAVGVSLALKKKKKKKERMKQEKMLTPEKNASSTAVADALEMDVEGDVEEMESRANELVAAAAAAMSEEKVKKLGKSGCLVFCAGEAQVYTLEQLMRASAEMLGRGSVGTTYKAVLDNRLIVSVKRLDASKMEMTGKEAFERHMDAVGRLRHPNLVPLRAYFQAKEERLLVYDYQPNGSLHSLIHGSRSTRAKPLHWTSCLKIAEDVAQGLAYIHQASRLVHGNVKSSNVLLGSDFEACLADNCLSFLVEPSDGEDNSGYRAPETRKSNRRLTPRSDIYAFGVLVLELLTGKLPLQHPVLLATDLPVWVRSVREDEGTDDERLMMIIDIAAACVRSSPESRPTTWQVLKMIQEVKEADTGDNDSDSTCIS
ncbi:probable inactive receptor kinase At5g67200 [Elaeis guineensis]|uniref:probable inactive receptor kinase At5g67200 n=1 Tax=Elaeis guineensis var. tenera TaxID=51953 RepID=UPI003C6D51D5